MCLVRLVSGFRLAFICQEPRLNRENVHSNRWCGIEEGGVRETEKLSLPVP